MKTKIATKNAPEAIGPYNQATEINGTIYVSGQVPLDKNTNELVKGGVKEQTQACLNHIKAILEEAGLSMEHVVKTTVFLSTLDDFASMNEVYSKEFKNYPARTTIAAKELARESFVVIEAIAVRS